MKQEVESEKTLLSEVQTAKFCGVTVLTLRKHRDKGNVQPVEYIPGVLTLYDPIAAKAFFDTDVRFQAARRARTGGKITVNCKLDADVM